MSTIAIRRKQKEQMLQTRWKQRKKRHIQTHSIVNCKTFSRFFVFDNCCAKQFAFNLLVNIICLSALWLIQQTNNRSLLACICLTDFQRSIDLVYLTLYANARAHFAHMLGFDRKSRSFIYLFHIKIYIGKDLHTFQVSTHFFSSSMAASARR